MWTCAYAGDCMLALLPPELFWTIRGMRCYDVHALRCLCILIAVFVQIGWALCRRGKAHRRPWRE